MTTAAKKDELLVTATVPMQGLIVGQAVLVDPSDPHIAGLLRVQALVPLEAPRPRRRGKT